MSFLAPAFLAALAAVGLPVVIHLLNKLRVRETRWAAMRFLQESIKRNQRRVRINDLLLLLLRCLVVAIFVLLFARPTLDRLDASDRADGPLTTVVLLDHSASMGQSDGVETRLDSARRAALAYVESLESGSAAGLYLVTDTFTAPVARPSRDLGLVRRSIELARQTDRGTDFLPAFRAALEALRDATGRREIRLFSDNQAIGWTDITRARQLLAEHPGVEFNLVPAAPAPEANLALVGLRLESGLPLADTPLRILAEVVNHGSAPAASVRVTLSINDSAPSAEAVIDQLAPGGTRFVPLLAQLPGPGPHTVTARLPADRLTMDNERVLALEVSTPRGVLLVESLPSADPVAASGFFLAAALAPVEDTAAASHYLRIQRTTADLLSPDEIARHRLVILADPQPLAPAAATALFEFVQNGGGLLVFPGGRIPSAYWENPPWRELLPALPGDPVDETVRWAPGPYHHALFALWNDPAAGRLDRIEFQRRVPLFPVEVASGQPAPSVLMRLANREAAFVERSVGRGRVLIVHGSAQSDWGNLPLHPAFVPLVHRMVSQLVGTEDLRLNLAPGEVFQRAVPVHQLNRDVFVRGPSAAADSTPLAVGRTELINGQPVARVRDTAVAGRHSVFIGQTEKPDFFFAVQPVPSESDLAIALPDVLRTTPGASDTAATRIEAQPVVSAAAPAWRPGALQLWWWLLIVACAASGAEFLLALRASRAR